MSRAVVDRAQRRAALDPLRSFCVTAPAGSGKTELLIQRYLALLARAEQPEQLLAITFTRKAAGEMRARIGAALTAAATQSAPSAAHAAHSWRLARAVCAVDRQRGWDLLRNPARFNIRTIDGFCSSLTRRMPLVSGCGGPVKTTEQPQRLYRQATRALLQHLADEGPGAADLAQLLLEFDGNWLRLEQLLVNMLDCRDQWLLYMGSGFADDDSGQQLQQLLSDSVTRLLEDSLAQLLQTLGDAREELLELYCYSRQQLGLTPTAPQPCAADMPGWRELAGLLLTGTGGWRQTLNKRQGFPADSGPARARKAQCLALLARLRERPGLLEQLQELRQLPPAVGAAPHWHSLLAVSRLLPLLAAELKLVFRASGEADYTEIAMAALAALGPDEQATELALQLDYTLRHILVDEFQDTALAQYELIRRLTRGWGEDNQQNPENPRTLFIVGDGMQSIYGFRDADPGLFFRAQARGFNGVMPEALTLQSNFRSAAGLVQWVNETFSAAFPPAIDLRSGAIPFAPAAAQRLPGDGPALCAAVFDTASDTAAAQEAAWMADQIEQGLASDRVESMAVLVRSRSHLRPIVRELKARGLNWQARDIDLLTRSTVVRDLLTLCQALHNRVDRVAWLALLRTPWCGLEMADLLCLARSLPGPALWPALALQPLPSGLSAAGRERLTRLLAGLQQAMQWRGRMGLRRWVEASWIALDGPACVEQLSELDDALAFFELLEARDSAAEPYAAAQLQEQVGALYAGSSTAHCKLQLMTLHKAKGLEFDWVFIPRLAQRPAAEERELLLWDDYHPAAPAPPGFLLAVDDQNAAGEATLYNFLHRQKKLKRAQEAIRLLYVGATRAAQKLFLSAGLQRDTGQGGWQAPPRQSLLHCIWEHFQDGLLEPTVSPATRTAPPQRPLWRLPLASSTDAPVAAPAAARSGALPGPPTIAPGTALKLVSRQLGTVVHMTLQRLSDRDEQALQALDCSSLRTWWQRCLRDLQLPLPALDEAVAGVEQAVRTVLADARGRFLLSCRREAAQSELALCGIGSDGCLQEYIIDRTYIDRSDMNGSAVADGVRWVVDYKTSAPAQGQALQDFLERERSRYQPQLARYRELMAGLDSRPVRSALYFTAIPYWLVLD